jgi:hypothetical protein
MAARGRERKFSREFAGFVRTRRRRFSLKLQTLLWRRKGDSQVLREPTIGHSEDWDVVQKPGSDEVFVVEGAETREAEMEVRFPSVYHLVLDEAQRT